MKYVQQFTLILMISIAGEALHAFLPLPVPATLYGIAVMLALLITGVLQVSQVRETAYALILIMPILFIPPTVGLIDTFPLILPVLPAYLIIFTVSTVVVMGVTGRVTQALLRQKQDGEVR